MAPEWRGKGFGRALLAELAKEVIEMGGARCMFVPSFPCVLVLRSIGGFENRRRIMRWRKKE